MPWLWYARVVLYLVLSLPGFYTAYDAAYMPGLLGSLYYTFAAGLNAAACAATKPTAKQWGWQWLACLQADANDKGTRQQGQGQGQGQQGRKAWSFCGLIASLPRLLVLDNLDKGSLPRKVFLIWYCTLNLALYVEAYSRHKETDKGRALRGLAFKLCGASPCPEGATGPDATDAPPNQLPQAPPLGLLTTHY